MMINKITHSVDYNQWLKRLDAQLNEPTNKNTIRVVKPTNKKTLLYNFGDQCNEKPNVPSLSEKDLIRMQDNSNSINAP